MCSANGLGAAGIVRWSGIESGSAFSANHSSMSERSHPPEACFRGNRPFFVQRNRVERFTPTTRRTSAVLILWSSATTLGRSAARINARRGFDIDRGSRKRRDNCRGHGSPIDFLLCARTVSSEGVCWQQENLATSAGNSRKVIGANSLHQQGAGILRMPCSR